MSANIIPAKVLCVNPVLPQAYGESLSYYEAICKLQDKLNETIEYLNNDALIGTFREYLGTLFFNALYIESTKTLLLNLSEDALNVDCGCDVSYANENISFVIEDDSECGCSADYENENITFDC